MRTWWYFRQTKTEDIEKQAEQAQKYVPDTDSWLGQHGKAAFKRCYDVTELIYSDKEKKHNFPPADRPIRKGDVVYVANLHCLGGQLNKIARVLIRFHESKIELVIPSISYHDDGMRNDYLLLYSVLMQIYRYRQQKPVLKKENYEKDKGVKKRGVGRPSRNIKYFMLSRNDRLTIEENAQGVITNKEALRRLQHAMPDGKPCTDDLFRKLKAEYKRIYMNNKGNGNTVVPK